MANKERSIGDGMDAGQVAIRTVLENNSMRRAKELEEKQVQELTMKSFEKEHPEDNQICLVEFPIYSEIFDSKRSAMKKRFTTLTWEEVDMCPFPHSGWFFNAKNDIVAVYEGARWCPIDKIRVVEK